ncbi:MAG TPA: energy transducer TonB [Candidatus Acidoferrum sp.]|jgi:protein TonB|nr:energy transducer TonB [Candidatus Acidoferrum sp.]
MSFEQQSSSDETLGTFRGCLVEGDPEQRKRERRIRRRALAISIALQSAAVTAALLVPLFGKSERIALAGMIPIPPYYHHRSPIHQNAAAPQHRPTTTICRICAPLRIPKHISTVANGPSQPPESTERLDLLNIGPDCPGCINMRGPQDPRPLQILDETPQKRLQVTHLDPAMLVHRVEPVYPPLARQTGRSGRVELRAIIATDGTIQSLQVVSGDLLFIQSALEAVQQWRYKPTILNDHAVEIDTFITVVYNINR